MKINLPQLFCQTDPKYAGTPIGNSNIGAIGCLTVCGAEIACYFGHSTDPSLLAKSVKYSGNLWIWSELTRLYPDIIYKGLTSTPSAVTDAQMNIIRATIDRGIPVFVMIETPIIPEHWLLAVDYVGDDFQCADPMSGTVHPITDYGVAPKISICAYGWYEGTTPQSSPDALTACLAQHTALVTEIDQAKATVQNLNQQIIQKNTEITTLQDSLVKQEAQLLTCNNNLVVATEQANKVAGLQSQVNDLTDKVAKRDLEISALQTQLGSLQAKIDKIKTTLVPKKYLSLKIYNLLMTME